MKGQLSNLALGVITALVILFIGLFTVSTVADLQSESDLYDFVYTSGSNTTADYINSTKTYNYALNISNLVSISGSTPTKTITVKVNNTNTTDSLTVNATLNGASLGTFSATNGTKTTHTFSKCSFVTNVNNNITVGSTMSNKTSLQVYNVTVVWPNDKTKSSFGNIFDSLVSNTTTIFEVLILVIIIVSLGVAIAVLRGMSGTRSVSPV